MVRSTPVTWIRGEELWAEGDGADWVLAICTGAVGLRRGADAESGRFVDIVVRGELAGEEAAVGAMRPASCVGLAAGKGRRLPRRALAEALRQQPNAWKTLMCVSSDRTATLAQSLESTSCATVSGRLATLLLSLAERVGLPDARGVMVPLRLARLDLAALVGCREETAVRHMRKWEKEGLVSTTREGFVLRDTDALSSLAAA
jgi:CRP/FNR family transcriptional regulator, nitrogen oxide reductase regulator